MNLGSIGSAILRLGGGESIRHSLRRVRSSDVYT